MKKLLSIMAVLLTTGLIAPSCTQDESFDEVVKNSSLDHPVNVDQEEDMTSKPGEN